MKALISKGIPCLVILFLCTSALFAQSSSVTIGPGDVKTNAVLWLVPSGGQGLLLPALTTTVRNGMNPNATDDEGMIVYDKDLNMVFFWNGSQWKECGGGSVTTLTGDVTGTPSATQVTGIKGKILPNLPSSAQALVYDGTNWVFQPISGGAGEANTASNVGTGGVGVFKQKTGVNLELRNINAASNLISVTQDAANNEVDINVNQANLAIAAAQVTGLGALATLGTVTSATITDLTIVNADIAAAAAIAVSKLAGGTNGQLLSTNASGTPVWIDRTGLDIQDLTLAGTTLSLTNDPTGGVTLGALSIATAVSGGVGGTITDLSITSADLANGAVSGGVGGTITDGSITNADLSSTAAIDVTKLNSGGAGNNGLILKVVAGALTFANDDVGTGAAILSPGQLLVGDGASNAAVAVGGDLSMTTSTTANFQLNASTVTATELAPDAVTTAKILDGTILLGDLANDAVDATKLRDDAAVDGNRAVTTNHIRDNAITSAKIANGSILAADLNGMGAGANDVLRFDGATWGPATLAAGGTVTSVALAMPSIFTVSGSPVTIAGTLTATLASQTANTIFAAPNGAAGVPTFRTMVAADVPALDVVKITTGTFGVARGGTGLATTPTNGQVLIGNGTGYALSTLTQGSGINITNGAGTITISSTGLANPMTTQGDIIFGGAAGAATRLAGATGVLKSTGAFAPTWGAVNLASADVTGTLPLTQGGTGATTAAGALTSIGALGTSLTSGQVFVGNGGNTAAGVALSGDIASVTPAGLVTISPNAITSAKIADGTVALGDLADDAVDATKLRDDAGVDANRAVTTNHIRDNAITSAKIANGSILAVDLNAMGAGNNDVLQFIAGSWVPTPLAAGGTVTSVALAMPSIFTVSGSPVTTTGTLTATLASQTANTFFAAPNGAAGAPTFRTMVAADVPALDVAKITTGTFGVARGGTGLATTPTNGQVLIGNGAGYGLSTLTQGAGISITNGAGSITIASTGLANPMTAQGDIIFGGAAGAATRLAGATGFLKSTGAFAPTWGAVNLASGDVTGTLPLTQGGTGVTNTPTNGQVLIGNGAGYSLTTLTQGSGISITNGAGTVTIASTGLANPMTTQGDLIFGGPAGAANRLAGATGVLKSTGAFPPLWGAVNLASPDVAGVLPVANGGTGGVLPVANGGTGGTTWNGLLLGSGATIGDITTGANGQILRVAGTTPTWSNFVVTSADITDGTIASADIGDGLITGADLAANINITTTGNITTNAPGNLAIAGSTTLSGSATLGSLAGAGTRMVVANATGVLSTQALPTGTALSTINVIPKGDGTTQIASSLTDIGTTLTTTADFNLATGKVIKINNVNVLSNIGTNTLFVGNNAGAANSGGNNTFVGFNSGQFNTTATENTFVGYLSGQDNTTGSFNVFVGRGAGSNMTAGGKNTFMGFNAGLNATGASNNGNTFIGADAGRATNSTFGLNNFFGEGAGMNNTQGYQNVFLGRNSGLTNLTGFANIMIGNDSDVGADGLSYAVAIGAGAIVSANNSLVLGGTGAQAVDVGIGIADPATTFHVVHANGSPGAGDGLTISNLGGTQSWSMFVSNATGNLTLFDDFATLRGQFDDSNGNYNVASDRRLKKNINMIESVLPKISAMKIRRYHFKKQDDKEPSNIGVIAQELQEVFPELVKYAEDQDILTVDYTSMAPLAIKAIQEQQEIINELKKQVEQLETTLKKEQSTNEQLTTKIEALADDIDYIKRSVGLDQKAKNNPKK